MSSGNSCGLRIPGTDSCTRRFSSAAFLSASSLSSRNKSLWSSPVNSLICTKKSLRCSLNAGKFWSRSKKPLIINLTWTLGANNLNEHNKQKLRIFIIRIDQILSTRDMFDRFFKKGWFKKPVENKNWFVSCLNVKTAC